MLIATVVQPELQGWALKATSSRWTRLLMVNHFVLFFEALRCIMQTLSIMQSAGHDVPTSSGESSGSSGT
jgi:hypothetical protein